MGPHLCFYRQGGYHDLEFCPRCRRDLLVPDVGADQGRDSLLRGGNVLSHVSTALAGCPEVHASSGENQVVPGVDEPIPMHEH